jgi:hypothetical protein
MLRANSISGLIITENRNYQRDEATYIPRFMTNIYARQRVSDMYYDYLNESTKENILKRDNMMLNMNHTYNVHPTVNRHRFFVFGEIGSMIRNPAQFPDIQERLNEIQTNAADVWADEWVGRKELQGWDFSSDPWGIPPAD